MAAKPLWMSVKYASLHAQMPVSAGYSFETEEYSMADTNIESRVIEIVSEQMGVSKDQVKRETEFQKDLNADSLDVVELVMELEEEFEITIPEDAQDKIKTVGAAVDFIDAELKKKS
jgi:acyl carrier protein